MPLNTAAPVHDTDDTASGGLYHDYPDEIHDANQADRDPDDDWAEYLPPKKLWVHPDLALDAETVCDPDEFEHATNDDGLVTVECPNSGCPNFIDIDSPMTYAGLKKLDGVARCLDCDEPLLAHQQPPWDYHTTGPGRGGGLP